jgi:hypothetical protein
MFWTRDLTGATEPIIRAYQINEAMATAGVPVIVGADNGSGVSLASTTAAADMIGVTLNAQATQVTAQQTDNSDPARRVQVVINPFGVFRALLTQGATASTALTLHTENTGSTTGLIVTTGASLAAYDEGTMWGFQGANAGIVRKISVGDATNADTTIAFPIDIAVGDTFLMAPMSEMRRHGVQLNTNLDQVDASATTNANTNFNPVAILARDNSDDGRNNSWVEMVARDHCYGGTS